MSVSNVRLPPFLEHATDCHCHIFGPADLYPLAEERKYDPDPAPLEAYLRLADDLGLRRMVVVQPTAYGFDNRCLLDALRTVGEERGRGVVALRPDTSDDEMHAMTEIGVRAARLNFVHGSTEPSRTMVRDIAARIAPHGWHLEIFAPSSFLADILEICPKLPVDVVVDHMGSLPPSDRSDTVALKAISAFLSSGRGWIKLCGYRTSRSGPPYADIGANARFLISRHLDRCVWGTDWPHGNVSHHPATHDLMKLLIDWTDDDDDLLQRILLMNPSALYGFPPEPAGGP
jgi:predicted TIM-barrel fold metal-dependent hydrolase